MWRKCFKVVAGTEERSKETEREREREREECKETKGEERSFFWGEEI